MLIWYWGLVSYRAILPQYPLYFWIHQVGAGDEWRVEWSLNLSLMQRLYVRLFCYFVRLHGMVLNIGEFVI
jgi:hypothetical protein